MTDPLMKPEGVYYIKTICQHSLMGSNSSFAIVNGEYYAQGVHSCANGNGIGKIIFCFFFFKFFFSFCFFF